MDEQTPLMKFFNQLRLKCGTSPSIQLSDGIHLTGVPNDDLYDAITRGDLSKCQELLEMGVMDQQEGDGASFPSHEAVKLTSPLHYAVMRREPEIIKLLLKYGADPNCVDTEGKTAIHSLILCWPRCVPKGNPSKLHGTAAYQKHLQEVDKVCRYSLWRLCAFGGNPNARDNRQQSPLHYAARFDIPSAATVLLEWGAHNDSIDIDRKTPLMLAAATGEESLEVLLQSKPNVHLTCIDGKTALHHAVESRCPKHKKQLCVKLLLQGGANPDVVDNTRSTALHYVCTKLPDETIIQCLLRARANPDIRDANLMTPLHLLLQNTNNLLTKDTILDLIDATLSYGIPNRQVPLAPNLPWLTFPVGAILTDHSPPSLQRICRKITRNQILKSLGSHYQDTKTEQIMEDAVTWLPLPKSLQRFIVLDATNPVRQMILGIKQIQNSQ
ncbi:ankyrin repeat domain-containing protein 61-like [Asterias rubens]|uniref:ankyrin repeat domain-containing protein 61-like n=1 Tax=Asterias rubens TaxID=7604 RepID=UPI00145552EF|nr:ankyrin repeat domain-containing protein 61-like [Asterias rubens]